MSHAAGRPPAPSIAASPSPGRAARLGALVLGAVSLLALVKPTLFGFGGSPAAFADLVSYRRFVAEWWEGGKVPYRDFVVEYPPGGYPFFLVPYFLEGAATRAAGLFGRRVTQLEAYALGFAPLMMAVEVALIGLVAWEARATRGDRAVPATVAWLVGYLLVMTPLAIVRFDLVATLATFGATMLIARGRAWAAGAVIGVGVLVKVIPGLALLPILGASRVVVPGGAKARAGAAATLVVLAGVVGWVAVGRAGVLDSVRYHSGRGFEIGSSYASVMIVGSLLTGRAMGQYYAHFSINAVGPGRDLLLRIAPVVLVGSLALVGARCRRIAGPGAPAGTPPAPNFGLHRATVAILLAFMLAGKVLSPQYLLWLMPAVAVAGRRRERALFLALCLLTTLGFPWFALEVVRFTPRAEALLVGRNVGLLILLAWFLRRVPAPAADPPGRATGLASGAAFG